MSSEQLHAPRERLTRDTVTMHQATISLMEELEAQDWYRQRADDCDDPALKAILLHHMREEIEHAAMILEWLRRNDADFAGQLRTYLFTEGDITEIEEAAEAGGGTSDPQATTGDRGDGEGHGRRIGFTIGPLK